MVRILIIRPGSTDFDDQGRIKGNLDIPLNPMGSEQVTQTVEDLRDQHIGFVYYSPCQAAKQTSEIIAEQLNVRHRKIEPLSNLDHGLWQGKLIEEVKAFQPKVYKRWQDQPESVCPPEGETLSSAQKRVRSVLEKIVKKHRTGCIALVIPEPLASIAHCELNHHQLGDLWQAENACCSWDLVEVHTDVLQTSHS